MARPRFTTPQQIFGRTAVWFTSGSQRQRSLPVRASTANTTLQLVMAYKVPFETRGVASWPPPPDPTSWDQANPSRFTLPVLIWLSGLKRVSAWVRPYVSHSVPVSPACFRTPSSTFRTCGPATSQADSTKAVSADNTVDVRHFMLVTFRGHVEAGGSGLYHEATKLMNIARLAFAPGTQHPALGTRHPARSPSASTQTER